MRLDMFKKIEQVALKKIRVWWRPISCVGIAAGLFVNAIYIPLATNQPLEPSGFAAIIASLATVFAVREWGKIKGVDQ